MTKKVLRLQDTRMSVYPTGIFYLFYCHLKNNADIDTCRIFLIKDRFQQALTMIENRTFSIMANCEDGLFLFLAVVSLMFCEIFHFEKENIDRWIRCSNSVVRIYRSQLNHHKPQITTDTHHFQLFPNKYWKFQHLFILTEIIEFPNTQTPAHTHTHTHTHERRFCPVDMLQVPSVL